MTGAEIRNAFKLDISEPTVARSRLVCRSTEPPISAHNGGESQSDVSGLPPYENYLRSEQPRGGARSSPEGNIRSRASNVAHCLPALPPTAARCTAWRFTVPLFLICPPSSLPFFFPTPFLKEHSQPRVHHLNCIEVRLLLLSQLQAFPLVPTLRQFGGPFKNRPSQNARSPILLRKQTAFKDNSSAITFFYKTVKLARRPTKKAQSPQTSPTTTPTSSFSTTFEAKHYTVHHVCQHHRTACRRCSRREPRSRHCGEHHRGSQEHLCCP